MRVLVIGAGGYIGSAIANSLKTHGHRVTGLVRKEEQRASLEKEEISAMVCDVLDGHGTVSWAQFEVVILAITSTEWEKQKAVVHSAHAAGCKVFCFACFFL